MFTISKNVSNIYVVGGGLMLQLTVSQSVNLDFEPLPGR